MKGRMKVGDRVVIYSGRLLPIGGITYAGTIVDVFRHPKFPESDDLAQVKVRLDKKIFWLFSVYEWRSGQKIWGLQSYEAAQADTTKAV